MNYKKEIKSCSFEGCDCLYIENRTKWLCHKHNFARNHEGKTEFQVAKEKYKSIKSSNNRKDVLEKDRELYKYWFDTKPCKCENCDCNLPTRFKDNNGKIIWIWQYSHILSKGAWPEFRHNKLNGNRLCFTCHQTWEFGDKESMNIYENNMKIIKQLKNGK